jgi:plastocyanin
MRHTRTLLTAALALASAAAVSAADVTVRVLDRNGQPLPDAVVMIETSAPGPRAALPADVVIGQEKMRFVPTLSVVPVGTPITFTNNDPWDHHLRGGLVGPGGVYLDPAKGFELRLAGRVAGKPPASAQQTFTQAGPHGLACHIHGSMRGHVYVSESPWARITGADGQARIAAVPEGAARVRIWVPEQLSDPAPVAIQVAAGMALVTLPTQVIPPRRRGAETPAAPYQDSSRQ